MPVGYLWSVGVVALGTLLALRPLRRPWPLGPLSFFFGIVVNELPFVAFCWLLAWTLLALAQGDFSSPGGLAALGVAALTTTGLVAVAWRGLQAGPAIEQAIGRELGTGRCRRPTPERTPACRGGIRSLASCWHLSRCGAVMWRGSRTSTTETQGGRIGWISIATAPIRPARRC